jgi:D-aminopeptidase
MSAQPRIGSLAPGGRNAITDVPGVAVGHATLADGDRQTGVTVVLPHPGDGYLEKSRAAAVVLNGFGKSVGLLQVEELGVIETPIALTNTFSCAAVAEGEIVSACRANPQIGRDLPTVNPLVLECNDGYLNDIQALSIEPRHYEEALRAAASEFERGSVGAGRGMSMFGVKGGIGSASRRSASGDGFTVGTLVLANFGRAADLILDGKRIGTELHRRLALPQAVVESGSIIMVIATDAPLEHRQLRRLALRAGAGLARTGSVYGHGSGDIVLAFSTANRIAHHADAAAKTADVLHETRLDPLFRAAADATEQAIVDALFSATAVQGFRGHSRRAFLDIYPDWQDQ